MAKDWEGGVNYERLRRERLGRAQAAIKSAGLGGVICFNFDNIRYVTGTNIGEWARDKFMRYTLCPAEGPPYLWDPAAPSKRIASPWIADNVAAPISTMQGALRPSMKVESTFAKQIKKALVHYGIEKQPIGIDIMELPMLRALEAEGIEVVDGQQALLDAREIKTWDEIELLKVAAAMVDATYVDIIKAVRPGTRENELVAIAHDRALTPCPAHAAVRTHTLSLTESFNRATWCSSTSCTRSMATVPATTARSSAANPTSIRLRPMKKPRSGSVILST